MSDCYLQKWNESLKTTSKAESYFYYKSLLTPKTYLFTNLPYSFKQSLVRLRTSTHDLMIDKGRHLGIDKDLRLCLFCKERNIQVIETEVHFLIECSKYDSTRKDIFGYTFSQGHNIDTFKMIMSNKSPKAIRKLSKYLYMQLSKYLFSALHVFWAGGLIFQK